MRVGSQHLLVDSGRFAYEGPLADKFRQSYALHTRGHNALIVDGQQQVSLPAVASAPLQEGVDFRIGEEVLHIPSQEKGSASRLDSPKYVAVAVAGAKSEGVKKKAPSSLVDWAFGSITFVGMPASVVHSRGLAYLNGSMWVVVDRLTYPDAGKVHAVESLWHVHPSCDVNNVSAAGARLVANETAASPGTGLDIAIAASGGWSWDNASVVRGRMTPTPQGWYSPTYGTAFESPTLVLEATVGGEDVPGLDQVSTANVSSQVAYAFAAYAIVPFVRPSLSLPTARIVSVNSTAATVEVTTTTDMDGTIACNVTVAVGPLPANTNNGQWS